MRLIMIEIIIVDDHPVFREGLKQILNDSPGMTVKGQAKNARECYELLKKISWNLVILDISLPDESGIEVLKQIKYCYPKASVLILSNYSEEQFAIRAFKSGAKGYMTKESAPREIIKAVNKIVQGKRYITSTFAEKVAEKLESGFKVIEHDKLSDREFQVMWLLGSGKSIKEIAEELVLTIQTISTYRTRILNKMDLNSNADIIRYAIKKGLVD
jgi:DNA-binding NarL/FixJ family response regulator